MGTRVGWSECSVCANVARTERDYCSHIQTYKGMKIGFLTNNDKHKFGKFAVHEVNHDLEFIELSWVAVPAFQDAYVLEKVASLKKAVDNGFNPSIDYNSNLEDKYASEGTNFSQAEQEVSDMFHKVPSSLESIAEAASCKNDECTFDPRKTNSNSGKENIKMAGEMNRIRIIREEVKHRTIANDFGASGQVAVDNKEYKWWATSSDRKDWQVSLEEGLSSISASGQSQIIKAIKDMITKNINSTDLIINSVSSKSFMKNSYLQGGEDSLLNTQVDKALANGEQPNYPNKELELEIGGDGREWDMKNIHETSKKGPSGEIGKTLPKGEETISKEDLAAKEPLSRAFRKEFLKYLARRGKI
jgi:hypothetical protein